MSNKNTKNISYIGKLGQQVGTEIIGQGMGMLDEAIMGNYRRKKQVEQQQKLTDIGTDASKQLMEEQRKHQFGMWEDTNYSAQMEQMRKAGLNPAMIYGGGGEGTTGTIGASSVSSGQASNEAERMQAQAHREGMGLQRAMMGAQIKSMEASANKDNADAEATRNLTPVRREGIETDIEHTKANILEITENINNKKIQAEGMRLQNSFDRVRNDIQEGTKEDVIRSVNYSANKIHAEVNSIRQNTEINEEQRKAILDALEQNVYNLQAEYLVKISQGKVNEEQANMIITELNNYDRKMKQKDREIDMREKVAKINKTYPGIQNVLGESFLNLRDKWELWFKY